MASVPASEPRYCVAQVVVETRDAWDRFCKREHINRTVLADVIGIWLDTTPPPSGLAELVSAARDLQDERRRRG